MQTAELIKLLEEMKTCAREAGELIKNARNSKQIVVNHKGRDHVTNLDLAAEKFIMERLEKIVPGAKFLSEEFAPEIDASALNKALWIIDPIDGTTNYARGHVHCGVSIAFAEQGKVVAGVVEAPFLQETYSAVLGMGAICNSSPIRCSALDKMSEALIATGFTYNRETKLDLHLHQARAVLSNAFDIRRAAACTIDLCWLASGRIDGYYEDVKPWDVAAAGLIAREAGAITGSLDHAPPGFPQDLFATGYIAAVPALYDELRTLLRSANRQG